MDGLINPWAAATDTLLQTLAQRDAAARLEEQKQRQLQLDAEDRADRERMRTHQENQLKDLAESRREAAADRQAGIDRLKRKEDQDAAMNDLKQSAIIAYNTAATPEEKAKHRQTLEMQFDMKFAAPKARTGSWRKSSGPGGTEVEDWVWDPAEGEDPAARTVYHPPKVGTGEKVDPRTKDNPLFPRGSQQWVDSVLARGGKLEDVVGEVTRGWGQQTAVHPNASLGEAVKYIKGFYGGPTNRPLVGGAAPGAGGVGESDLRAQAVAALEQRNKNLQPGEQPFDTSEDAIATVMQNLQRRGAGAGPAAGPAARPAAGPAAGGQVEVDLSKMGSLQPPPGLGGGGGGANLRMAPPPQAPGPPTVRPLLTATQRAQAVQELRKAGYPTNDEDLIQQQHQALVVQGRAPMTAPQPQRPQTTAVLTPTQRQQSIATLKMNNMPVTEQAIQEMYRTLVMQGQVWPTTPGR